MSEIEYIETDSAGLDTIGPLWRKLLTHHAARSRRFSGHFGSMIFDRRKQQLLEKSRGGALDIHIARDGDSGGLVGYCVSTINGDRQGEVESIYIEPEYRHCGIGDALMKKALRWMEENGVKKKVLVVAEGNEEVFLFYRRYGFHPRVTVLEQIETEEAGENVGQNKD